MEQHGDFGAGFGGPFHERFEHRPVCVRKKAAKGAARHLLERIFDHPGEALVRVENRLVRRQGQRAFVHGFDEQPVNVLRPVEREHLGTFLASHHHAVHFAGADGAERFFRCREAGAEPGEFVGRCAGGGAGGARHFERAVFGGRSSGAHGVTRPTGLINAGRLHSAILPFLIRSSSTNRPLMFAKLPMNRRSGLGSSMMSVGVATIWFVRASAGC